MELQEDQNKPTGYRVEDDKNLTEKDLQHSLKDNDDSVDERGMKPVREGEPMGGQNFGKNNVTPAGDDKNNSSRYVGYNNAYLSRDEPSEEHPENNNFKDPNQLGQPNYTTAADAANTGQSDTENTGPKKEDPDVADADDNKNESDVSYQEGTADGNDDVNIPGPNEVPDQQKVGE